ncbi:UNVERIFIED_CONTAM: hypothetical protein NCL1_55703 [Trichonephila clavipes]
MSGPMLYRRLSDLRLDSADAGLHPQVLRRRSVQSGGESVRESPLAARTCALAGPSQTAAGRTAAYRVHRAVAGRRVLSWQLLSGQGLDGTGAGPAGSPVQQSVDAPQSLLR